MGKNIARLMDRNEDPSYYVTPKEKVLSFFSKGLFFCLKTLFFKTHLVVPRLFKLNIFVFMPTPKTMLFSKHEAAAGGVRVVHRSQPMGDLPSLFPTGAFSVWKVSVWLWLVQSLEWHRGVEKIWQMLCVLWEKLFFFFKL